MNPELAKQHRAEAVRPPPSEWYFVESKNKATQETFDMTSTHYCALFDAFMAWQEQPDLEQPVLNALFEFLKLEADNIQSAEFKSRTRRRPLDVVPFFFDHALRRPSIFNSSTVITNRYRYRLPHLKLQDFPLTKSGKMLRVAFSDETTRGTWEHREQSLTTDVEVNSVRLDYHGSDDIRAIPPAKTVVIGAPSGCGKTLNGMLVGACDPASDGSLTSAVLYTTFSTQRNALNDFERTYSDRKDGDVPRRNAAAEAIVSAEVERALEAAGLPVKPGLVVAPSRHSTVVLLLDELGSHRAFVRAVIGARSAIQESVAMLTGATEVRVLVAGTGITAHNAAIGSQASEYHVWKPDTEPICQTLFATLPSSVNAALVAPSEEMLPEAKVASAVAKQNPRAAALIVIELNRALATPACREIDDHSRWNRLIGAAVYTAALNFKQLNSLAPVQSDQYMAKAAAAASSAFFVTLPNEWFHCYASDYGLLDDRAVAVVKPGAVSADDTDLSNVTDPALFVPARFHGQRFEILESNILMAEVYEGVDTREANEVGFKRFVCDYLRWAALMGRPFQVLREARCNPVRLPHAMRVCAARGPVAVQFWLTPCEYFVGRVGAAAQHPHGVRIEPLSFKVEPGVGADIDKLRRVAALATTSTSPHDVLLLNGAAARFADVIWVRGAIKELVLVQCKHYPKSSALESSACESSAFESSALESSAFESGAFESRLHEADVHAELAKMGWSDGNPACRLVAKLQHDFPRPHKKARNVRDDAKTAEAAGDGHDETHKSWAVQVCTALGCENDMSGKFAREVMNALCDPRHWKALRDVLGKPENVDRCKKCLDQSGADALLAALTHATGTNKVRWLIVVCGVPPHDVQDPQLISAINAHEVSLVYGPAGSSQDDRLRVFYPVGAPTESNRPSYSRALDTLIPSAATAGPAASP